MIQNEKTLWGYLVFCFRGSMKTKPLTFLLALAFLFLFSGSVYGDDLQDGMGANEREVFRSIIFSAEIVIS